MLSTPDGHALCAGRATRLIVAACRTAPRPRVLLPAIFCAEVADALEAAGLEYRCYDLPSDLSCAAREIERAMGDDIGAVIVLHPFGLSRAPGPLQVPPDVLIVEDACHALRTSMLDSRIGAAAGLTVYSFRKELSWGEGAFARGPLVRTLKRIVPSSIRVARRWALVDRAAMLQAGQRMTRAAAQRLGGRLPPLADCEVLTALPLRSRRRDACVRRLRARGIEAWRWRGRLHGVGPAATPQAWRLKRELFLVPFGNPGDAERTLDSIELEPLGDWQEPRIERR